MARPKRYANGTVTRSLSLSTDADKALTRLAAKSGETRSQAASTAILAAIGKVPKLADTPR